MILHRPGSPSGKDNQVPLRNLFLSGLLSIGTRYFALTLCVCECVFVCGSQHVSRRQPSPAGRVLKACGEAQGVVVVCLIMWLLVCGTLRDQQKTMCVDHAMLGFAMTTQFSDLCGTLRGMRYIGQYSPGGKWHPDRRFGFSGVESVRLSPKGGATQFTDVSWALGKHRPSSGRGSSNSVGTRSEVRQRATFNDSEAILERPSTRQCGGRSDSLCMSRGIRRRLRRAPREVCGRMTLALADAVAADVAWRGAPRNCLLSCGAAHMQQHPALAPARGGAVRTRRSACDVLRRSSRESKTDRAQLWSD